MSPLCCPSQTQRRSSTAPENDIKADSSRNSKEEPEPSFVMVTKATKE